MEKLVIFHIQAYKQGWNNLDQTGVLLGGVVIPI